MKVPLCDFYTGGDLKLDFQKLESQVREVILKKYLFSIGKKLEL
jgi:hypothetical protein